METTAAPVWNPDHADRYSHQKRLSPTTEEVTIKICNSCIQNTVLHNLY